MTIVLKKMTRKVLVIGEKPSQVRTITETLLSQISSEKVNSRLYLKKGYWKNKQFIFLPLVGHITSIDTSDDFGWNKCQPLDIIQNPNALIIKKNALFQRLISQKAKEVDELWLATDPDSEGDNIAYEAFTIAINSNPELISSTLRIWNSSLTRVEIIRSFENPIKWNTSLALAVQGRRIIDAWVGFAGTREITNSARKIIKQRGVVLSVGRVQLPTLKLVVDRDRERNEFVSVEKYNLFADILDNQRKTIIIAIKHDSSPFEELNEVKKIIKKISSETTAIVNDFNTKKVNIPPPKPLNTTDALAILSKNLKLNAERGLQILANLYEEGYLSYPRTDNRQFKAEFPHKEILAKLYSYPDFQPLIKTIKEANQVRTNGRKMGVEDHDPIHPTGVIPKESIKIDLQHLKTWNLISRYYIGMFMPDLIQSRGKVKLNIKEEPFIQDFQQIETIGWTEAIYWKKPIETTYFSFKKGDVVQVGDFRSKKFKTQAPPNWSDGSIIKMLEKLRIGTKSSRPEILLKLIERKYVIRSGTTYQGTNLGHSIISLFENIWPDLVTPHFTRMVETKMDEVATQKASYQNMLEEIKHYYLKLHELLLSQTDGFEELLVDIINQDESFHSSSFETPKNEICPVCRTGHIIQRFNPKTKKIFFGCSRYPECRWTSPAKKNAKGKYLPVSSQSNVLGSCPSCQGSLVLKKVSNYRLIGCTNYPACQVTFFLPKKGRVTITKQECPICSLRLISLYSPRKDNKESPKKVLCAICKK